MIIKHLPQDSALVRATQPDEAPWTLEAHLMATVADGIHWLQWAKTKDAEKGRNRPDPIPRPGVQDDENVKKIRGTPEPVNDIVDWLGPEFAQFALTS